MTYAEIIKNNCETVDVKWWPRYAYHFTDVSNAVNILKTGCLFSRIKAQEAKVMANDNASTQVINMTESAATSSVRFYFRPLTPTQYYNEGFKHSDIRYNGDANANVPVPVFFMFDLEKLISNEETRFSEFSQAGHSSPVFSGTDAFEKFDFDKIYSNGFVDDETRKYRQAEILYPSAYSIDDSLRYILCRNEIEKSTLLNLLKSQKEGFKFFSKYKNIIKVCKTDMFEKNGLFLDDVTFGINCVSFYFSDTYNKRKYEQTQMPKYNIEKLPPVSAEFKFAWLTGSGGSISEIQFERFIDYQNPVPVAFDKLPEIKDARRLVVSLLIEGKLICYLERPTSEIELL